MVSISTIRVLVIVNCTSGRWVRTRFDWPCHSVHWSGQVCPGFSGSWLRPLDMGSKKLALMSHVLRLVVLEPQRAIPQALTILREARFIAWRLRCLFLGECQWELRHFWSCWATPQCPDPPKKRLCATIVRLVGCTKNTEFYSSSIQFTSGHATNTPVWPQPTLPTSANPTWHRR